MRSAHGMYDLNMERRLVAKFYYGKAKSKNAKDYCKRDVEMQGIYIWQNIKKYIIYL